MNPDETRRVIEASINSQNHIEPPFKDYNKNKTKNVIRLENAINESIVFLVYTFAALVAVVVLFRAVHLVNSECFNWMSDENIKTIDFIISAFFFGQGGNYLFAKAKEQFSTPEQKQKNEEDSIQA